MRSLPPLDVHAHVDPAIAAHELVALGAAVFAVTRSLDEAETALMRTDTNTIWGVGCHPGLVGAQKGFSSERFATLIRATPFVGEIGLDGKSRVPMETQVATLRAVLRVLQDQPRITTIHSYAATQQILDVLSEHKTRGAILHWWLGTVEQTTQAVELGCYFSINAAMCKREELLQAIPLARVLTETDHPFGDRPTRGEHRPGLVMPVETALARLHGTSPQMIRLQVWQNLRVLSGETSGGSLLPTTVRRHLAAI
jgi:TatD DNase family protein